jgi:hypothetical protein
VSTDEAAILRKAYEDQRQTTAKLVKDREKLVAKVRSCEKAIGDSEFQEKLIRNRLKYLGEADPGQESGSIGAYEG